MDVVLRRDSSTNAETSNMGLGFGLYVSSQSPPWLWSANASNNPYVSSCLNWVQWTPGNGALKNYVSFWNRQRLVPSACHLIRFTPHALCCIKRQGTRGESPMAVALSPGRVATIARGSLRASRGRLPAKGRAMQFLLLGNGGLKMIIICFLRARVQTNDVLF